MAEPTTTGTGAVAPQDSLRGRQAGGVLTRLYTGAGGVDIVGRSRRWFTIAAAVIVIALAAIAIRGFSLGIDFEGGTRMTMPAGQVAEEAAEEVFTDATGVVPEQVQIIGSGEGRVLEITSTRLGEAEIGDAREALFEEFAPVDATGAPSPDTIGDSTVSESWGSSITERMLIAAVVFLVLVFGYITLRFERDMAIAAIAGLLVDGVVILGCYSLTGLQVSPATVIGLLTVLSFSLYDTVVVFDKVEENTAGFAGSTRRSYPELVNLAVNQSIMRSINTTVSTLLPVAALLLIAVWALGVSTLADLAVIQFIGIIEGTFSSIFLAAPILVALKSRQRKYREHAARVAAARAGEDPEAAGEAAAAEAGAPRAGIDPAPGAGESGPLTWRPGGR